MNVEDAKERLRSAFAEEEEKIRNHVPALCRGEFTAENEFWLQYCRDRETNPLNHKIKDARKVRCELRFEDEVNTRVSVRLSRPWWAIGALALVLAVLCAEAGRHIVAIDAGRRFGARLLGLVLGVAVLCALGIVVAWTWRRDESAAAKYAIMKAARVYRGK